MGDIEKFFKEQVRLPSPPIVALKILQAVKSDDSSFEELADIIRVDPALTVQVLKLANSSLYGLSKTVDSIAQATALIGTQTLKNIALSFVFVNRFQVVSGNGFDMELFWRRAVTSAVAAQVLATRVNSTDKDIFVSGLLQDIGVLVLFLSDRALYTEVFDDKRLSGKSISASEKDRFGFDHAEVGSHLLQLWNLSESIVLPIREHHLHDGVSNSGESAVLLYVADRIASIYHGSGGSGASVEINRILADRFELSEETVEKIIDEVGNTAQEVLQLFDIDHGEMKPLSLIIQEANEELRRLNLSYEQIVLDLRKAKKNAEKMAMELKQANNKLRELIIRDELTGLFNHRHFQERLESEIEFYSRYGHQFSLLIVDIDYFKKVNDTYGHQVGDRVLKETGRTMVSLVRNCDIVARYGGEEFAIIMPATGTNGAKVLAQRLRRGVEQNRIYCAEQEIRITISIGLVSTDMMTGEVKSRTMFSRCDEALYRAKNNGRNRVEF
ncbi:MAG: hypothetical protein CR981_01280 [Proteobacteria bacterium]|nr:MAG: hypothetical protein CR981_01280 [Pseudomonadota bacterium]PIE64446.1 MAG: hypothetical protein CSA26_08200 [Desulfobacterales bacterium]